MPAGKKPEYLSKPQKYQHFWLIPVKKTVPQIPIKVWAFRHSNGWTGWIDKTRGKEGGPVMPAHWSKEMWAETTEKRASQVVKEATQAAEKAAAKATVKRRPGVKKTEPAPKKPEPPEPTPTPTGTDGPSAPADEVSETAQALETAVQTLGTLAQVLRRQSAESRGINRPGLAKTRVAPPPPVRRVTKK